MLLYRIAVRIINVHLPEASLALAFALKCSTASIVTTVQSICPDKPIAETVVAYFKGGLSKLKLCHSGVKDLITF